MEYEKVEIVTPKSYFNIVTGGSNRNFYKWKSFVVTVGEEIGLAPFDGHFSEKCDYEGDLESITVYTQKYKQAILDKLGIKDDIRDMVLEISIF